MVCDGCEGKCPICDSVATEGERVRICGECSFGSLKEKCIVCGSIAKNPVYYCQNCILLGKNRDGCPRIINSGFNRSDVYFEKKKVITINEDNS